MSGKDFAPSAMPTPESVRPISNSRVLLLSMLALAVVASCFAGGYWLGKETGMQLANSENETRLREELKQQKEEINRLRTAASKQVPEASTVQVGELTFYNELPKQSVRPAPLSGSHKMPESQDPLRVVVQEAMKSADKELAGIRQEQFAQSQAEKYYRVQLASFEQKSDAHLLLGKLSAGGIKAEVKQVDIPRLGTRYRVYSEKFAKREFAEKMQTRIKGLFHITGLVVLSD